MSDTAHNERLALKVGWEELYSTVEGVCFWKAPDGSAHAKLPDFCGDDCAAVKWLLPWLRGQLTGEGIRAEELVIRYTARSEVITAALDGEIVGEDSIEYRGYKWSIDAKSLSGTLAAAVESLEVESAN